MPQAIPKQMMEDIRFHSDIVQVISAYMPLQRNGANFKALCPFHKEKTPSFHVNTQRQSFHCFGCGKGGDVFSFIMEHESMDFMSAVRMLAARAGIHIELEEDSSAGVNKQLLYTIHAEVATLYRQALGERSSAEHARRYMQERDLTGEVVDTFNIGYAPDRWDAVLQWGERKGYSREVMEQSGLILRSDKEGGHHEYYDRFRGRLMFPICDEQGRVIGFSGRTMEKDAKGAKYVNSPETPLFRKSRVLYALDKARRAMVERREALVCEGQIDVIRCHQAGFNYAVASQGTAFTEDHVRIIKRYADSICLCFDSDKAGQDATVRSAMLFLDAGLAVRVATLPPGEDPDSFIRKHHAEAFSKRLDCAESIVSFQINVLEQRGEKIRSQVGAMRAARAVLETIRHTPNAVQRANLIQEAAERLRLPPTALQDDLRNLMARHNRAPAEPDAPAAPPLDPEAPLEEKTLCHYLFHAFEEPAMAQEVRDFLPLDLISHPRCRTIATCALEAATTGDNVIDVLRQRHQDDAALIQLAATIEDMPNTMIGREFKRQDAVRDLILMLWRKKLERDRAALPANTDRERAQLTHHLHHLKKWEDGHAIIQIIMATH
jgi:DNA primase